MSPIEQPNGVVATNWAQDPWEQNNAITEVLTEHKKHYQTLQEGEFYTPCLSFAASGQTP